MNNLANCKSVVKTLIRLLDSWLLLPLQGHNERRLAMRRSDLCGSSCRAITAILLAASACLNLVAQIAASPQQAQGRSSPLGSLPGIQAGQSQVCTPAEYGDRTADCIQPRTQTGYSPFGYNPYGDMTGLDPSARFPSGSSAMDGAGSVRDTTTSAPAYIQKEPPTEFQQYVADTTGQMLPIFGASLFEHVPVTFAPVDRIPVSGDYRIAAGDELQVAVWGQFNLSRRLVVDRSGQIPIPEAGPLSVAGMTSQEAAAVLKSALARLYKGFDVSISLGRLHSIQVFVVGQARRPGSYTVSALSTLVNTVFASGGPSSRGSMRHIQLKRSGQPLCNFDLYELLLNGDKSKDISLLPGDVIFIPAAGPRIALTGSVEHPGIYEVRPDTTLREALELADGLSPLASAGQVLLERFDGGNALKEIHVAMSPEGLQTSLLNGDIIRIQSLIPRFRNAVTLRGNVADPGRYPWKQGMRLSDIIPDKDSLLTRDYWNGRNALGNVSLPPIAEEREAADTAGATIGKTAESTAQQSSQATALRNATFAVAYQEQKRNTQADASFGAATEIDNLPPTRTFTPHNTVQPAVPEINWEYAVVERTDPATLATRTVPFNLGKLVLSHDESQNVILLPGDVVTIFSKADFSIARSQQLTQVRIEGEVAMAGIYTVEPGETLRQVLARAGGLSRNAYLYGTQFTRESTRREQQKRYDDFLNQLEREMAEAASNLSSRVTSPQQAATAQTSLASQHDLVDRMRKISMNGRIVLDIDPNGQGIQSFPDLPLENGDRLFIPSRPSTVNVIGTVYDQASFLYQEDYRTGDYLKKAGGPSRSADRSHMFVIRADGSVISHHSSSPLFAKSFEAVPMYPGDTLVVPTYINHSTFVRSLLDWSQILSSFGLGAAAINVLR